MAVGVSLEQLLGGAVLQTVWAWLPNANAPSKLLVPAAGAQISIADRVSGDAVPVFPDDSLLGSPVAQPLVVDTDGHVTGFVSQPARLTATVSGAGLDPRVIPIGSDRDPVSITDVHVVASDAAMLAIAGAHPGTVAVRTDLANSAFMHNGGSAGTDADWTEIGFVNVVSVNGHTGVVALGPADVGADASGAAAAVLASSLQKAQNLADLADAGTARTNLGLGSAATQASGAFDASGAAAAAQAAAQLASIPLTQKGAASGVAQLDASSLVPESEMPAAAVLRHASAIAYAAAITPALPTLGDAVYNVAALTGAMTINNPTGTPVDGQLIRFRFAQDATGGRVITWGTVYAFGSDVQQTMIPATASATWTMIFEYDAAQGKWWCTGIARGF